MDKAVDALKKTVISKEYKDLAKCASKHCSEYEKLIQEEEELVKEVSKLQSDIGKIKSITEIMKRSRNLIEKSIRLLELNQKKKALMCVIKECGNEYVSMVYKKNENMAAVYKDQIKQIDKTIKVFSKREKKNAKK